MQRNINQKKKAPTFFTEKSASNKTPEEADHDAEKNIVRMKHTIELCCEITRIHRLLTKDGFNPQPERNIIQRLAYLYRLHLFNIAIAGITLNAKRDRFFLLRTRLVHCITAALLDEALLRQTQIQLRDLKLNELDQLNAVIDKISCDDIFEHMQALDIYNLILEQNEDIYRNQTHLEVEEWLRTFAVPLLNSCHPQHTSHEHKQDRYDAIRLIILVIGDYKPNDRKDEFYSDKIYYEFMCKCVGLRRHLSHNVHNVRIYDDLNQLLNLGKKITTQTLMLTEDVIANISPFNTQHAKHIQTRHSGK